MRNRARQRPCDTRQRTLLESLELRRLLSASLPITAFAGSVNLPLTWQPAAANSRNLAASSDGSLWYVANNALQQYTPGGSTSTFTLPAQDEGDITDLAVTANGNVYIALSHNDNTQLLMFGFGGFNDVAAPAHMGEIAAAGNNVWLAVGNGTLEQLGGNPITVTGIDGFNGLAVDAQGNAWFTASSGTQGIIGKVTPAGGVTTYSVAGQPADLAVSGSSVWYIDSANAAAPLARMSNGLVAHFAPTPQAAINSLAAAPDGRVWAMAPGALATVSTTVLSSDGSSLGNTITNSYALSTSAGNATFITSGIALSNIGSGIVVTLSTAGTTTTDSNPSPTSNNTPPTDTGSTTTQPGTGNGTPDPAPSPGPSTPAPRPPVGDPGIFQGEFGITPRPTPPKQGPSNPGSSSQSNAGNSNSNRTFAAQSSVPALMPEEATDTPPELIVVAAPSDTAVPEASPLAVTTAAAPVSDNSSNAVVSNAHDTAPSAAAARAESDAIPSSRDETAAWWKLAIAMSSAAGIELGRGQRYFRL